jgi:hypothetical protein
METFQAYHTDIHAPGWQRHTAAQLREQGLVTFSGITERTGLIAIARPLMAIRPHRDAGPDGVTVITKTQDKSSGFTGFTDTELIPHTDGSAVPSPPGLLLLVRLPASRRRGRKHASRRRRPRYQGTRRPAPRLLGPAVRTASRLLRDSGCLSRRPTGTSRARPDAHPASAR